jgi:hypothetical protein
MTAGAYDIPRNHLGLQSLASEPRRNPPFCGRSDTAPKTKSRPAETRERRDKSSTSSSPRTGNIDSCAVARPGLRERRWWRSHLSGLGPGIRRAALPQHTKRQAQSGIAYPHDTGRKHRCRCHAAVSRGLRSPLPSPRSRIGAAQHVHAPGPWHLSQEIPSTRVVFSKRLFGCGPARLSAYVP